MLSEDLNVFLDAADFATLATLTSLGISSEINVIFDYEFSPMLAIDAEGRSITAMAKSADVATVRHHDTITINATPYRITGIHPLDDGAFTELELSL